jgi:putative two-component system response regulator
VRPYKGAFSHEKAVDIIRKSRGSHFDPLIVDVFFDVNNLFAKVEP